MILGVGLEIRVPDGFVAEHDLAFDDRRHFAVAAAEVEADAAPVQMAAQRSGAAAFGRQGFRMDHLDRVIEHPLAHEVRVELARGCLAIMRRQLRGQRRRPVEVNAEAAARPEQELRDALQVSEIARRLRMGVRQNRGREVGDVAVGLFQGQADGHGVARGLRLRTKGAVGQDRGPKRRVEHR